jgi:hypothetical protein
MAYNDQYSAWIAWDWAILPGEKTTTCPSPSAILGTFAAVNAAVSLFSVLCGHRAVVRAITAGRLGRPNNNPNGNPDSNSWKYMWIVSAGLQLGANAAVAALIGSAFGYTGGFKIWKFMLFYIARPRLSWIILGFLGTVKVRCDRSGRRDGGRFWIRSLPAE